MKLFPDDIFNLADIALDVARTDPERTAVIEQDGYDSRGSAVTNITPTGSFPRMLKLWPWGFARWALPS